MTAFSDDANIRAFRLVAAALNAPVAQPPWTESLLASLMPPLPLVDCQPLSTWAQTSTTAASANSGSSFTSRQSQINRPAPQAVAGEPIPLAAPARASAQPPWSSHDGPPFSPSSSDSQRDDPRPALQGHPTPPDHRYEPLSPKLPSSQLPSPVVPSGSHRGTTAPNRTPSPSPWPKTPGYTLQPELETPLSALDEIGRLTGEILSEGLAPGSFRGAKPNPTGPSRSPQRSPLSPTRQSPRANQSEVSPPTHLPPIPPPATTHSPPTHASVPAAKLNLATLAALYAGDSLIAGHAPALDSLAATQREGARPDVTLYPHQTARHQGSAAFATPDLGDFADQDAPLPEWPIVSPGPSPMEMAETLTEMVSAILQAQAQRHGVDMS